MTLREILDILDTKMYDNKINPTQYSIDKLRNADLDNKDDLNELSVYTDYIREIIYSFKIKAHIIDHLINDFKKEKEVQNCTYAFEIHNLVYEVEGLLNLYKEEEDPELIQLIQDEIISVDNGLIMNFINGEIVVDYYLYNLIEDKDMKKQFISYFGLNKELINKEI